MRYYGLKEAVAELRRRQSDPALVALADKATGDACPVPTGAYGFLGRQVASCRLEDVLFAERCQDAGISPYWLEFTGDRFSTRSPDKMRLTRILVGQGAGRNGGERVFSYHVIRQPSRWEGRSLAEVVTDRGEPLVEFHHRLREIAFDGRDGHHSDVTLWLGKLGHQARDFYFGYLAAFTVRGILFEDFTPDDSVSLSRFDGQVVYPAYQRVVRTIGVEPLIVRHPESASRQDGKRIMDHYCDKVVSALCPG